MFISRCGPGHLRYKKGAAIIVQTAQGYILAHARPICTRDRDCDWSCKASRVLIPGLFMTVETNGKGRSTLVHTY